MRRVSSEEGEEAGAVSVEKMFEGKPVPSWSQQLTFRALFVSSLISFFLTFIVTYLNLTTGIIPSLNVSAGMLGFFFVKAWTKALDKLGIANHPFTRQENTVIQTCVVAATGIAYSGGFGSYILAMSSMVAKQQIENQSMALNTKEPSLGWMISFAFVVSLVGLFSMMPLRKVMIIQYKLTYPSGTASAHLINSFHTPNGANVSKKQMSILLKSICGSFLWSLFQWFYTAGDGCGFINFPIFGLKAYKNKFYFDFSAIYVGVGMISPYIITISLLLGSILSWGILWPYIHSKRGIWYSEELKLGSSNGLQGYKVFVPIAMILGDGLFHFLELLIKGFYDIYKKCKEKEYIIPIASCTSSESEALSFDERQRNQLFLQDHIPTWVAALLYTLLAAISIIIVPFIFHKLKFYHIIIVYMISPLFAFFNAYGYGLTDWSLASNYGKLVIFIFGMWVGIANGGILAGLAVCGVMMSVVATGSDLIQNLKTGYMTLSSPRSIFISQVIGTAMGCIIGPINFWLMRKTFVVNSPDLEYPPPYLNNASVYRGIAIIGAQGLSALPKHCLHFCLAFFVAAIFINAMKEWFRYKNWRVHRIMPSVAAMAVPFFVGSYFTIDMCVGSLILFLWERANKQHANAFASALASGLICGSGMWSLPSSLLALSNVKPPICMKFLSRADNAKLAGLLGHV